MRSSFFTATAALIGASMVSAQTFTDCDPTKKTCPTETALGASVDIDFTKGASKQFYNLPGTELTYGKDGAEFTIREESNAPTIESPWHILFGTIEVTMKAARGQGIVSSFVLESSTLDEVDWEWIGSDSVSVQSNYYGKGNTTTYDRAMYHPISNPQDAFHTYKIEWTSEYLKWFIDGAEIRHLSYNDANGGQNFPQTPMKVKLGNWVGGGKNSPEGTVQWAGGLAQWDQAPFTMYVKNVKITDGHPGAKTYTYGDRSGSWQSILIDGAEGQQLAEGDNTSTEIEETSTTVVPTSTKTSTTVAPSTTSSTSTEFSSTSTSTEVSSTLVTSTKATSTKASSTVVSTSTEADETTSLTSVPSSKPTTISPSANGTATDSPSETSPPTVPTGAAGKVGANFAMVMAAGAALYFAL